MQAFLFAVQQPPSGKKLSGISSLRSVGNAFSNGFLFRKQQTPGGKHSQAGHLARIFNAEDAIWGTNKKTQKPVIVSRP